MTCGDMQETIDYIRSFGVWAMLFSFCLDVLVNALGFLPSIFISTANGVIFSCSEVTMGEIRDGTTNTYLIGEKYLKADAYETSGSSSDDNGVWVGADCDNCRVTYKATTSVPMQDRAAYDDYSMRFGSPHAGSFGMCMCDGSTQRISYSIDQETHYNLGVRNDGQAVNLNQ